MEFEFKQSYVDTTNDICVYGYKKLYLDKNFKYIKYFNEKIPLTYISNIRFGNQNVKRDVASRDIEIHTMFRAEHDDLVVVRRFNGVKYYIDRIDYLNIEFRLLHNDIITKNKQC